MAYVSHLDDEWWQLIVSLKCTGRHCRHVPGRLLDRIFLERKFAHDRPCQRKSRLFSYFRILATPNPRTDRAASFFSNFFYTRQTCSTVGNPPFPGTNLPNCTFLAAGIEKCQQAGKTVTLSIGGATGNVGFASESQGQAYAQVIWDVFLGGSSSTRPFGTAVLDGCVFLLKPLFLGDGHTLTWWRYILELTWTSRAGRRRDMLLS